VQLQEHDQGGQLGLDQPPVGVASTSRIVNVVDDGSFGGAISRPPATAFDPTTGLLLAETTDSPILLEVTTNQPGLTYAWTASNLDGTFTIPLPGTGPQSSVDPLAILDTLCTSDQHIIVTVVPTDPTTGASFPPISETILRLNCVIQ
jgi:hypothetical protein